MEQFKEIIANILLLFGLVFIISLSNKSLEQKNRKSKFLLGFVIGFITIFIMMNAWEVTDGIFYDTRSVMISVTALFFSFETSIIATLVSMVYRIIIGGSGVYSGVLSLFFSFLIGIVWKKFLMEKLRINKYLNYYFMGLTVHIFVFLSQFALKNQNSYDIINAVWPIQLLLFPVAVFLLSFSISNHNKRLLSQDEIRRNEVKYRTLVDNATLGIIQYDTNAVIIHANKAFANILGTTQEELHLFSMMKLPDKNLLKALKESLSGKISIYQGDYVSYLSKKEVPVRVQFSPIYDNNQIIGGIGTIEDQSSIKKYQSRITELSTNDILTKLLNRIAFDLELLRNVSYEDTAISISTCDINTFHVINTTFGYEKGNEVLIEISNAIKEVIAPHPNIKAYRVGGDEFALIMTGYDEVEGLKIMEQISNKFRNENSFDFDLSISCGISTTSEDLPTLSHVFNSAISKMHTNKVYDGSSISIKTVDLIMRTLFEKSKRERYHSERVSSLAKTIAKELSSDQSFINRTELAGRLHDIGKITVLEEILEKQGKLTSSEYAKIKKHSETGYSILSSVPEYREIANIVLFHHERYDGTGYPNGLKHSDTPLESRIICVADAYDAMVNTRPYRKGLSTDEAMEELQKYSGTQFDPKVVNVVIKLKEEGAI